MTSTDPSSDLPPGKFNVRAAARLTSILRGNPDCDRAAVIRALRRWLIVQLVLDDMAAKVRALDDAQPDEAAKILAAAVAIARKEHVAIETAIAAATGRN